ncbi:hypothetical protein SAMIE_1017430 [Sphingobium amiense]|uniref:Calcium-binding protein n=1 Tax=Sphingobium amiense TaxID=135719 RepID=A0A494WCF0_9SPHN|nr:hypothetical protein [Sphingobium amiense]BBD98242.1 hypothetical protein SAMIE_1017430 [Sphingobium amiense]
MADLYLSSGDNLTGVTFGGNVFGAAGTETVTYTNNATGIVVDQNVEQVRLAGATSSYTFQQAGNQLLVFSSGAQVARITLQNDTNGTLISFANGTVEAKVSASGLTLGGTTVPSTAASPVVPTTIDSSSGTAVQTLTLTPGPDTFVATNGDDVFNALTVSAAGDEANTLSDFDDLDGGAGSDTLNIFTDANNNRTLPSTASIQNIETVNIINTTPAAANIADASKFVGVEELWQINAANNVTNLSEGTVAGFRNADLSAGLNVQATDVATSVSIALDNTRGTGIFGGPNDQLIVVNGGPTSATSSLNSVSVSGTIVKGDETDADEASLILVANAGANVETFSVNTAVETILVVNENAASAASADIRTIDASASAGSIFFDGTVGGGTAGSVATIKTGAGDDIVELVTATAVDASATSVDETVSATVSTAAGADDILINTTGAGTTTVDAGDGDDVVTLNSRGDGKLTINLGADVDTFNVTGGATVNAGDTIDAGAGSDTLLLNIVGAANIGAFSNFEVFDAVGLNKELDVNILATNNTVTEFVASGDVGATQAQLSNVGANVGYRVTGDTNVVNDLVFNQATPGALTVTLDIDELTAPSAATTAANRDASVTTNATSVNAVFDSAFFDAATGATDNATNLQINAGAATTLSVVSGGANATNDLDFTGASLTNVTVSGAQALNLDLSNQVTSVNASALTGNLAFDLANLAAGGSITLGSGDDVLAAANDRSIVGFEKGTAEDAAAQSGFDVITLASAVQADDAAPAGSGYELENGLLTFTGAGPATLAEARSLANTAADAVGETLVFEYLGDSYVFSQGAVTDTVIELSGVTGLTGLDTVGANTNVYVF